MCFIKFQTIFAKYKKFADFCPYNGLSTCFFVSQFLFFQKNHIRAFKMYTVAYDTMQVTGSI